MPDSPSQIKLLSGKAIVTMRLEMSLYITLITAAVEDQSWKFPGISEDTSIQWNQLLFSKSRTTVNPKMFCDLVKDIISVIVLILE